MPTLATTSFKYFYQVLVPGLFIFFAWVNPLGGISATEKLAGLSFWSCPFLKWTGFACPGCGLTRSMIAFFSRDLEASFYFHPLGPMIGFAAVFLWAYSFFLKDFSYAGVLAQIPSPLRQWVTRRALVPGLAVLVAWGILRNVLDLH